MAPQGMRHQILRAAHDEFGQFGVERTLARLAEHYWFPKMRECVEKYISCCIPCLFYKRTGKVEALLHPIDKGDCPFQTFHIDHLGPFPKSKRGNEYIMIGIDGFTKFAFLNAVKSTKQEPILCHLWNSCHHNY